MPQWITLKGLTKYDTALELMEKYVDELIINPYEERLLLLEHEEVFTHGYNASDSDLIIDTDIPVVPVGRGGKYTYHGPGQRVIYPILNLALPNRAKDLKLYIKNLEKWIILTLEHFDIKSFTVEDRVGIWTIVDGTECKIASIGVRVKKWITYHGIAVNLNTDLSKFQHIIPCGLKEFSMTSMAQLGCDVNFESFDKALKQSFSVIFGE